MASKLPAAPAYPHPRPDPVALDRAGRVFAATRTALAAWFSTAARDLPWRRAYRPGSGDLALSAVPRRFPYASWIAEIMLQQTQVAAALPHYERWMRRFPDVRTLAAADEEDVLRAWAGLGYYARARNLHRGAKALAAAGTWPVHPAEWERIPGVGPYTAGALASLVFGVRAPLLDGNAIRVFSRVLGLGFLPAAGAREKAFYWEAARRFADAEDPGTQNEALMELGARVCVPSSPRCGECPLAPGCAARRRGWQESLPPPRARPRPQARTLVAVVLRRAGCVRMETREAGFLSGHQMFPLLETDAVEPWLRAAGVEDPGAVRAAGTLRHTIMHVRYEVHVRVADASAPPARGAASGLADGQQVREEDVEGRLSNALARKVWALARAAPPLDPGQGARGAAQQRKPRARLE